LHPRRRYTRYESAIEMRGFIDLLIADLMV